MKFYSTGNRRRFMKSALVCAGLGVSCGLNAEESEESEKSEELKKAENIQKSVGIAPSNRESRIALNTATILHYDLPLAEQLSLAHDAGFRNIEIWFRDLDRFIESGGTLSELKKRLEDLNLRVVGGINFFQWGTSDESARQKGLEEMRHGMEQMAALDCRHFAAAPAGIHNRNDISLAELADRYRTILKLGEEFEVYPQLEIWGGGSTLSKLSDAVWVATETAHPHASLLLDVYHLYRGGNDFNSLRQLNGRQLVNFHWNDWPDGRERESLKDGDRVFPGDGAAPLEFVRNTLDEIGYAGTFSLEIFNKEYCTKYSPAELLQIAYQKMRKAA